MAKITIMSYKDTNAPQIIANNRTAFYGLLDVWMKDGYNQKFVRNLYTQPNRTIVLEYAAPHGYKQGHLIKITGATNPLFNKAFRCISVTSDTLTLRLDKDDTATYPTTDSSTQKTYRSKNTTKSSQLYYTFKEPTNTILKTTGAVCYSVDISKDFDLSTGSNLNSIFESQKTTSDGTNFYVLTDYYTTPLSNPNNGKAGTYLPWFVVATDTFVLFTLGGYCNGDNTTNPLADIHYRNYNRTNLYVATQYYYFGDFIPFNEIEYTQRTSSCFYFYRYIQGSFNGSINDQNYPCINVTYTASGGTFFLTDTYIPSGSYAQGSCRNLVTYGAGYSGSSANYLPYPSYNITGLLCTPFYVFQQNSTVANNPNYVLRGEMPIGTFVSNSFQLFTSNGQEGNPFILEPSGDIYDEFLVMLNSGYSSQYGNLTASPYGFSFFTLD